MFDFEAQMGDPVKVVGLDSRLDFDTSDFEILVTEADRSLNTAVSFYRQRMTEVLNETGGIINEQADLIMEGAVDGVYKKLLKILDAIKNWIVKFFNMIIAKIQTKLLSDKKIFQEMRPVLTELYNNPRSVIRTLKAEMHEYNFRAIDLTKIEGSWGTLYSDFKYDLTEEFSDTLPDDKKKHLSDNVKTVEKIDDGYLINKAANIIFATNAKSLDDLQDSANKALRNNSKRKPVLFTPDLFTIVENVSRAQADINRVHGELVRQVHELQSNLMNAISIDNRSKNIYNGNPRILATERIAYHRARIRIINTAMLVYTRLTQVKINAILEQYTEARRFIVYAYRYKNNALTNPVNENAEEVTENAFIEPYTAYLDLDDHTIKGVGLIGII